VDTDARSAGASAAGVEVSRSVYGASVHVVGSGCSPCEPVPFARAGTLPVAHAEAPVRSSQRVAATCHSGSAVSLTAAPVSPALAHLTANTHVLGSFYFVRGSGFS
jgi:hypothetical protein